MNEKKYKGLERDASAAIKAIMFEVEQAAGQDPVEGAHPYILEKRRKVVIRKVWGLLRTCMSMMEQMERFHNDTRRF